MFRFLLINLLTRPLHGKRGQWVRQTLPLVQSVLVFLPSICSNLCHGTGELLGIGSLLLLCGLGIKLGFPG